MGRIRILFSIQPRVLAEIFRRLIEVQEDMEVVGEWLDPVKLLLAVRQEEPDVIILTAPDPSSEPGICSHLLSEHPNLVILAFSPERECAFVYHMMIGKEPVMDMSERGILEVIRRSTCVA